MSHSDPRSPGSSSTRPPRAAGRPLFNALLGLYVDAPVLRTCLTCGGSGKVRQNTRDAATLIVARALLEAGRVCATCKGVGRG